MTWISYSHHLNTWIWGKRKQHPQICPTPTQQWRLPAGEWWHSVEKVLLLHPSVFEVANGFARISIDSSTLSRRSSSSSASNSNTKFPFSIPKYFTAEETRASLLLLLSKVLLSSSSSASSQLLEILEQDVLSSDYTLNDVASDDLALFDYSVAAIDGVVFVLDHCSFALSSVSDAVTTLSCEALRANVLPFNLMDVMILLGMKLEKIEKVAFQLKLHKIRLKLECL
ncbi:hypothetical protein Salat_2471100 [Sesamum alatum]|uniref:Uncharacterized protein n=1 Tax=Sesamum alatum TaxID=300844 RepID=A0AAE1XR58_9LAMI|nr:hypothetical protein Salat_2471100 [Sesamum alatum]